MWHMSDSSKENVCTRMHVVQELDILLPKHAVGVSIAYLQYYDEPITTYTLQ